ncbi:MAG: hypothetical protein AAF135_03315 [Bacteroidota bacterium]
MAHAKSVELTKVPAVLPPLMWSATTSFSNSTYTRTVKQTISTASLVVIDWGDGVKEAYNAISSGAAQSFSHTYALGTPNNCEIKAYGCESYLVGLDLIEQEIVAVDLEDLTALTNVKLSKNRIEQTVNLTNSKNLGTCEIMLNTGTNPLILSVFDVAKLFLKDSPNIEGVLDLKDANGLLDLRFSNTKVTGLILPDPNSRAGLPLQAIRGVNSLIHGHLDVSNYEQLELLKFDLPRTGSLKLTSINVSNLPALENINLRMQAVGGTVDLSASTLLQGCRMSDMTNAVAATISISDVGSLDLANSNFIGTLDLQNVTRMTFCNISGTDITSVPMPPLSARSTIPLTDFNAQFTNLTSLDLRDFPSLFKVRARNCAISQFQITGSPLVDELSILNNALAGTLDLSDQVNMRSLNIDYNNVNSFSLILPNTSHLLKTITAPGSLLSGTLDLTHASDIETITLDATPITEILLPTSLNTVSNKDLDISLNQCSNLDVTDIQGVADHILNWMNNPSLNYTFSGSSLKVFKTVGMTILTIADFNDPPLQTDLGTIHNAGWTVTPTP